MSQEGKSIHPVARAIFAIIALIIIVVSGNLIISKLGIGHKTLDMTEDKIHSLSDGTKEILDELAAPVVIRYYASRNTPYMPEELKLHMRRVDDLLSEYERLSNGKLRVEELDPEPETDAEDSANLDGMTGQSINGENLYFGLAISCLDRTSKIPFLDPGAETLLEYEISRRIAEVSATRKPLVGIMSAVDLQGGPPAMMGQPGAPSWVIYDQLRQSYEVDDLTMNPGEIDPEKYNLLFVFHPAGITPEAEYQIDQYVLKGGTVIACLDPYSYTVQRTQGGNPMMGAQGTPVSSTLPTLLDNWGVEMNGSQVVADGKYQTKVSGNRSALAILTVPQEGMPQDDDIVTQNLASVRFFFAGGMTKKGGGSGVNMKTLVQASDQSGLVDAEPASRIDPSTDAQFRVDPKMYNLVMHLYGNFPTAFPDGDPSATPETEEETGDETEEGGDDEAAADDSDKTEEDSGSLKEGIKQGNVFLISDVDAFYDRYAYDVQQIGNLRYSRPINGNSSLLFNLIDQAASSTHLIGARSRAATSRPFTVFTELENEAREKVGAKIEEFQAKAQEANQRLMDLQAQRSRNDNVYLTPEQEAEIVDLKKQQLEANKMIRELNKDLRKEKDAIAARIIVYNIAGIPLLIIVIGLALFTIRRVRTAAR